MSDMAQFGNALGYDVIIEGILSKKKYATMLGRLLKKFDRTYTFYLDVSFEETVRRHQTKSKKNEFGEDEMRNWWIEKDYLGADGEIILPEALSTDEVLRLIVEKVRWKCYTKASNAEALFYQFSECSNELSR